MQIEAATIKRTDGTSKSIVHVPLLLSKCKEGSDRNRIQCMVFDFVVHPDTCRMAHNNARYKVLTNCLYLQLPTNILLCLDCLVTCKSVCIYTSDVQANQVSCKSS